MTQIQDVCHYLESQAFQEAITNRMSAWRDPFEVFGHDLGFLGNRSFYESALQSAIYGELYQWLVANQGEMAWFLSIEQPLPGVRDMSEDGNVLVADDRDMRVDLLFACKDGDGPKLAALVIEVKANFDIGSVGNDIARIETAISETRDRDDFEVSGGLVFFAWDSAHAVGTQNPNIVALGIQTPIWQAEPELVDDDRVRDIQPEDDPVRQQPLRRSARRRRALFV